MATADLASGDSSLMEEARENQVHNDGTDRNEAYDLRAEFRALLENAKREAADATRAIVEEITAELRRQDSAMAHVGASNNPPQVSENPHRRETSGDVYGRPVLSHDHAMRSPSTPATFSGFHETRATPPSNRPHYPGHNEHGYTPHINIKLTIKVFPFVSQLYNLVFEMSIYFVTLSIPFL